MAQESDYFPYGRYNFELIPEEYRGYVMGRYALCSEDDIFTIRNAIDELKRADEAGVLEPPLGDLSQEQITWLTTSKEISRGSARDFTRFARPILALVLEEKDQYTLGIVQKIPITRADLQRAHSRTASRLGDIVSTGFDSIDTD